MEYKNRYWGTIALWHRYEYNKNDQQISVALYNGKKSLYILIMICSALRLEEIMKVIIAVHVYR